MTNAGLPADELIAHAEFLRNLARAMLGHDADAEDVVQEAMAAGLRAGPRDRSRARGWLAGVVRNLSMARRRAEGRRRKHQRSSPPPAPPSPPDEVASRIELERLLVQAVEELEEPYRSAVVHRYLDGHPPRVIANHAGVPVRTIESRIRRGLEQLRGKLARRRKDWRAMLLPLAGLPFAARAATAPLATGAIAAAAAGIAVVVSALLAWQVAIHRDSRAVDVPRSEPRPARKHAAEAKPQRKNAATGAEDELRLLLYHLRHGSYARRREALAAILELGPRAAPGIPEMAALLADPADRWGHLRPRLALALARLMPASERAIRDLARHEQEAARRGAARAIALAGGRFDGGIAILERMARSDWRERRAALNALAELGPPGAESLVRLVTEGPGRDGFEPWSLRRAGRHAAPGLARRLSHADPGVRARAARGLEAIGRDAVHARDAIGDALRDESFGDRARLIDVGRSLGLAGIMPASLLRSIVERGHDAEIRAAARALDALHPDERDYVARVLSAHLSGHDENRRLLAAELLADHDRHGGDALEAMWAAAAAGDPDAAYLFGAEAADFTADQRATWLPLLVERLRRSPTDGLAPRVLLSWGEQGVDALAPHADRLGPMMKPRLAAAMLASGREREQSLAFARKVLKTETGFWIIVFAGRHLAGLEDELRSMVRSRHDYALFAARALVELQGEAAHPLVRELADDPEHPGAKAARRLLARKAARADHDGDAALRRRLGGHATFDRWRAALALHAKTGDWEPARAILDEFWELGRELAPVAAALRKMPGAKADAVADAVRLLGHSDDEVRLETIRAVAGWGEDARPLLGTIRGRAGAAEPDADVRHAARALIASFD